MRDPLRQLRWAPATRRERASLEAPQAGPESARSGEPLVSPSEFAGAVASWLSADPGGFLDAWDSDDRLHTPATLRLLDHLLIEAVAAEDRVAAQLLGARRYVAERLLAAGRASWERELAIAARMDQLAEGAAAAGPTETEIADLVGQVAAFVRLTPGTRLAVAAEAAVVRWAGAARDGQVVAAPSATSASSATPPPVWMPGWSSW